jgi:hypothetical protein
MLKNFQRFSPLKEGRHDNPNYYIKKPLGYSWFPKEITPIPKIWVQTTGNLVFCRYHAEVYVPSIVLLRNSLMPAGWPFCCLRTA